MDTLIVETDLEWAFIDGSIVKAHQHGIGVVRPMSKAQRSENRWPVNTTKIHMAVDAYELPIHFSVTGGEVHDCKEAPG